MEDILIIGGGPAGLAAAVALKQHAFRPTIIENGANVGNSWRRMPQNLKLGPWVSSRLDDSIPWYRLYKSPSAYEFADYLEQYATTHELKIAQKTRVQSVVKTERGFVVKTNGKDLKSKCIVNATGYFQNPITPGWVQGLNPDCKVMHYGNYRNPEDLAPSGEKLRILIVGGRVSAGELLIDLADTNHEIILSSRHEIDFDRPKWIQRLAAPFYFYFEDLVTRGKKPSKGSSVRRMEGGKTSQLLHSGKIKQISEVRGAAGNSIIHDSGKLSVDLVLLATGWKASLSHLPDKLLDDAQEPRCQSMQSLAWPGMFFIGFDNLRSFRSRFLRGIREDATFLCAEIKRYLSDSNNV